MQLKESGIQVPLTNNTESRNQDCLGFPYVGQYSGVGSGRPFFLSAERENSRTRARAQGEERRGSLLSPSRVPLARPLKKINRRQEHITRSEQLPCPRLMAFPRTSSFSEQFWRNFFWLLISFKFQKPVSHFFAF